MIYLSFPVGPTIIISRDCFAEGDAVPHAGQEKDVRGRSRRGKRQIPTGAERLRLDRLGHRFHVRMRRVRVGRDRGQVGGRPRGGAVFHLGGDRVVVFRWANSADSCRMIRTVVVADPKVVYAIEI